MPLLCQNLPWKGKYPLYRSSILVRCGCIGSGLALQRRASLPTLGFYSP